jgi:hypothetical protein
MRRRQSYEVPIDAKPMTAFNLPNPVLKYAKEGPVLLYSDIIRFTNCISPRVYAPYAAPYNEKAQTWRTVAVHYCYADTMPQEDVVAFFRSVIAMVEMHNPEVKVRWAKPHNLKGLTK